MPVGHPKKDIKDFVVDVDKMVRQVNDHRSSDATLLAPKSHRFPEELSNYIKLPMQLVRQSCPAIEEAFLAPSGKKFVEEDCPILMKTLEIGDDPIPLWWTADMINASLGKCWEAVPVAEQKWVVGEFNCSCVGVSKCLPA